MYYLLIVRLSLQTEACANIIFDQHTARYLQNIFLNFVLPKKRMALFKMLHLWCCPHTIKLIPTLLPLPSNYIIAISTFITL